MNLLNNNQILFAIAQNIGKAREDAGMKQDTAAKALQISRSTLSKYENGDLRNLTIDSLLAMSKLYQKPLVHFFPNDPCINFIFNPSDGALNNTNQQAYLLQNHSEGYKELITHLKEEIEFLRTNIPVLKNSS